MSEEKKAAKPAGAIQRRIIFINKDLQYRFILVVACMVFVGVGLTVYEFLSHLNAFYAENPSLLIPVQGKLVPMIIDIIIKLLIYMTLVILAATILSHKLAGPIFNFEKTFDTVSKGDFSKRVRLRKGDLLISMEKAFNKMMDAVEAAVKVKKGD